MPRFLLLLIFTALLAGAAKPKYESDVVTTRTPGHAVEINADITEATQLFLVVTDGGNDFSCDWADWIEPKIVGPKGELKLTDLKWKSATAQWGKAQVGKNVNGGPLRVAGKPVEGIGTHANSVIEYELPKGYTTFLAKGGLDEGGTSQNGGSATSVRFAVYTEKPTLSPGRSKGGLDALESLARLDVPDDLEIGIFAAEPELRNPTSIDIDHRGRIWVCEVVNYRQFRNSDSPERAEGDRILILEDTDGDAKADKTTVFYQGRDIDSAHGIAVLGNKAIVSAGENVFVFTDSDGDGKADQKELLFTGIGGKQHDHGIHAFAFGPDGRLYFNFGNEGHQLKDKNGKFVIDLAGREVRDDGKPYRQGMVFRCDLDGSNVETLAWNFRNNWELAVDSFGNIWQSDNDDDGNRAVRINFVMEFGNYGYQDEFTGAGWRAPRTNLEASIPEQHWHLNDPGVVPTLLITGQGAPTGIVVYEGDLLPERFRGQMIHADAGPNVVRAYPTQTDGAGYTATIEDIAVGTRDQWFRPSDVAIAPDGSLFIADWYDPGVGGHRMEDIERGRIFRVAPKGEAKRYTSPSFDLSSPKGAVQALSSPNLEARYLAWIALRDAGDAARPALEALWRSDEPRMRARALWVLGNGRNSTHYIDEAIKDNNPDIRITGLRLARQLALRGTHDLKLTLESLAIDESPQVRREVAIALRQLESADAAPLWASLAQQYDGEDRWYLEALGIAAEGRWDAFLTAWQARVGQNWSNSSGRDIVWRSRARETPRLIAEVLDEGALEERDVPRFLRAFDFQTEEAAQPVLAELAFGMNQDNERSRFLSAEALSRIKRLNLDDPAKRKAFDQVLAHARGTKRFVELVEQFDLKDHDTELVALAVEHPTDETGIAAVQSLLRRDRKEVLQEVLQGGKPDEASRLAEAIGNSATGGSQSLLIPIVRNANADAEVRRKSVTGLAKTRNGAERLLKFVKDGELDDALLPAAAAALQAVSDPKLRSEVNELFPPPPGKGKPLPPISELAKRKGDANNGRLIYLDTGTCSKCHQFMGVGQNVGPDLSEIGDKLSREALYESILYPSAGISHNYEAYAAITSDGTVVTGLLVSQTPDEIALKGSDAITRTFKTSEIEELVKQDVSLMPADLQKVLTEQELVDLVEFLTTLKKPK